MYAHIILFYPHSNENFCLYLQVITSNKWCLHRCMAVLWARWEDIPIRWATIPTWWTIQTWEDNPSTISIQTTSKVSTKNLFLKSLYIHVEGILDGCNNCNTLICSSDWGISHLTREYILDSSFCWFRKGRDSQLWFWLLANLAQWDNFHIVLFRLFDTDKDTKYKCILKHVTFRYRCVDLFVNLNFDNL